MSALLPIAPRERVRQETTRLLRRHRRAFAFSVTAHGAAAVVALAGPALLGHLVQDFTDGSATGSSVDHAVALLAVAVLIQAGLAWYANRSSLVLGERVFAEMREDFLREVTRLPLSVVERAGSGDLISRTTNDVEAVSHSVRYAVPNVVVGVISLAVTVAAILVTSPLVGLAALTGAFFIVPTTRWYLRRARDGYLAEMAAYARLDGTVSETLDGASTVAALRLGERRRQRVDDDLREVYRAERYTLSLRTVWSPLVEFGYIIPTAAVLAWGGWLTLTGRASAGEVTTVALYVSQLMGPLDLILEWTDELQIGGASLARIIGIGQVPDDRTASASASDLLDGSRTIQAHDVRYAYRGDLDVLHGVSLTLRPGERLAVVGPSGAGKSTLGRLLAGIHPPRTGAVTVSAGVGVGASSTGTGSGPGLSSISSPGSISSSGLSSSSSPGPSPGPSPCLSSISSPGLSSISSPSPGLSSSPNSNSNSSSGSGSGPSSGSSPEISLVALPLPDLRQQVALVTQEQHVFVGTLADNLRLARADSPDPELMRALDAVDALPWVLTLPEGLSTVVGSGGHSLTPSQAQQVALARLVLSDPHTLVLDEATSLLDPRAARHLERSLSAVLSGRTVVAVAHRLHTAHDADRVAVVEGGQITELGTHDELLQHAGSYAALWRSWQES